MQPIKSRQNLANWRRLLEFTLIILLCSFLFNKGREYFVRPIEHARQSQADYHAGIFTRMINNLNVTGTRSNESFITFHGERIYLNEKGWPANTDSRLSPSIHNQTAEECLQLWQSIFETPPSYALEGNAYKKNVEYSISLNKKVICRYKWLAIQEGSFFIDYDITNGSVNAIRVN